MRVFLDANLLIYLNAGSTDEILDFWIRILTSNDLYLDVLVLDEVYWISKKKYNIPYQETTEFLEEEVLPYVTVLPLTLSEYRTATGLLPKYNIKPSDALHIAAMINNSIKRIASEDKELDKIKDIERIWIQ